MPKARFHRLVAPSIERRSIQDIGLESIELVQEPKIEIRPLVRKLMTISLPQWL